MGKEQVRNGYVYFVKEKSCPDMDVDAQVGHTGVDWDDGRDIYSTTHLNIDICCLSTTDSPFAINDSERHTIDALLARIRTHLLHFLLQFVRLEEFDCL